ncbi:PilC/PilY family type IV pilus protein [Roseateles sp. SL47]|uniref:pilus assembly protein n=1 Tax=Roseateles sp. SL47 TaxID=2995138 RepID=UPI0022722ACF|nr:PilC/PilY family type IV pilus protein [Roseateles sp. SL47]WAC74264.1 PilC/PilY family type IV pilus protein [Roseateles sp. SL47]
MHSNLHLVSRPLMMVAGALLLAGAAAAQTTLGNQPVFSSVAVPGNVALTLSVEYPTAVSNAHIDTTYTPSSTYIGYFDPAKCYTYTYSSTETSRYFQPAGNASSHVCSGKWSGNFLNWATMQTIDPYRWALTGGYRTTDTSTTTIIEKAYATGQGTTSEFPDRTLSVASTISGATPFSWSALKLRIQGLGNRLRFTSTGDNNSSSTTATAYGSTTTVSAKTVYEVSVRVKVCDTTSGAGDLESNCVKYDSGYYKPEGLIQKYSQKIRFAAFGYLNDATLTRDGGVLRARMKYVGPQQPVPGSDAITNTAAEWSGTTGVMVTNPDSTDASTTASAYGITISNSGVINYVNKFGEITPGSYKSYDPVGELYYAALRYYRNLGNVTEWSSAGSASTASKTTYADGFPVITSWGDPILYSCQKNFILGIGDVNTHADRNVPGATGSAEPSQPSAVKADTALDAVKWTNKVGVLHGLGSSLGTTSPYNSCCNYNGALMAGMAYYANTQDLRSDLDGTQTIKTYWLDVMEYQTYKSNNQFYLATKYGGFTVPSGWDALGTTTDIPQSSWHSGASTDVVGTQLRPDTYYIASKADTMVSSLSSAFASIATDIAAYTSSFDTASDTVDSGSASYASSYDSSGWTGDVTAYTINSVATPVTYTQAWKFSAQLAAQMGSAGTGWDTARYIVTWNPSSGAGVPFRTGSLTSTQLSNLDPTWTTSSDASAYLNWLRGDQSQEQNATASNSTRAYRTRTSTALVGDIVNSGVAVLGPPGAPGSYLTEAANPGYTAHYNTYKSRPNLLVTGDNNGLVHVINGALSGTSAGRELFAFIPNALFAGPNNTPSVDGLASVGNPDYTHHYMVDAKPAVGEVDFKKTAGSSLTSNDWHSIAVGGLGKGGRSIYALDLTTANGVASEASAATRVLWEYTDSDMGFSFGTPVITKTNQYGWVVIVGSGMNNSSGKGAFYILNARTGALLQKVALPTTGGTDAIDNGTTASPANLAYLSTYYRDTTDGTIESVYAGDMNGNLWRLDLTAASGTYPSPVKIAKLTNSSGVALPITSEPTPNIDASGRRWIGVGTGQLLSTSDLTTTTLNRIVVVRDGYETRYATTADLPSGVSWPFLQNGTRSDLQDISTTTGALATGKVGYVIDLYTATGTAGYRVVYPGDGYSNYMSYSAIRPSSTNACSSSGVSTTFDIDLSTGTATQTQYNFVVTSTRYVETDGVVKRVVSGKPATTTSASTTQDGDTASTVGSSSSGNKKVINWREIPLHE